jgi:hypothetical protein
LGIPRWAHRVAREAASEVKAQAEAKFHMTTLFHVDGLTKALDSIQVVRVLCGIRIDPVRGCCNNPEGLSCGDWLVGVVPGLSSWSTV